MRTVLIAALAAIVLTATPSISAAQEVTIRLHHFLSQRAPLHSQMLVPFAEKVANASGGRLKIEIFDSMSLGGRPGDLFDQAVDGAVDAVLTLPGYTPGRFNRAEVFELPFIMTDTVATSKAFWDLIDSKLQGGEFDEVQVLSGWVHGPGVIHSKDPIASLEDMRGKELRGPTRIVTDLLGELGATPVGMPLPLIPENLSKGVITGTVIPWEVTPSIRLAELVAHHTEISGDRALYTAVFILAMNLDAYDALPDDLRDILDAETGKAMAEFASTVMVGADAFGRSQAEGNTIVTLDEDEVARWIEASEPVYGRWIERAKDQGFDGVAAIAEAQALIAANR
ncbi:MAG: TRAP transporter substrate-binding protein [Pseudomonadota bacterium]